jgi:hypothetical protein
MKKNIPIYLYGAIIILEGIFLILSGHNTFKIIKLTTGVSIIISALVAFIVVISRQKKQVQYAYHLMHALALLVFGISILLFCNSFEKLITFTSFLFFFYSFSEIIFSFWLFNLGQKVVYKIIIVRFLLGLAIGIGTIVAMNFSTFTMEVFGILFIMVGINIILYVPVMKAKESNEIQNSSKTLKR